MILMKVAITAAMLFVVVSMVLTACDEEWADTFKRFDWIIDKVIVGCAMAGAGSALLAFLFFVWGI